jgi:hypothetical protein
VSLWVRDLPAPERKRPRGARTVRKEPPEPPQPTELRACRRCLRILLDTDFNRYRGGRQWWCRDCFREYFQARGDLHVRQTHRARARRREEARRIVIEHLQTHPCVDCGEDDITVLEFDHLKEKRGGICTLQNDGLSAAALRAEIAKCDVVCANCHRIRTAYRTRSWRLRPLYLDSRYADRPELARNRAYVRDVMLRSGCVDCGLRDLVTLEFDHVRGRKSADVSALVRNGWSLERVRQELACCEVRCANCHRRRTARERGTHRARWAGLNP